MCSPHSGGWVIWGTRGSCLTLIFSPLIAKLHDLCSPTLCPTVPKKLDFPNAVRSSSTPATLRRISTTKISTADTVGPRNGALYAAFAALKSFVARQNHQMAKNCSPNCSWRRDACQAIFFAPKSCLALIFSANRRLAHGGSITVGDLSTMFRQRRVPAK